MIKTIFYIFVGLALGYFIGFDDAQVHSDNMVVRAVNAVGGSNRQNLKTDVDKQMENVEQ